MEGTNLIDAMPTASPALRLCCWLLLLFLFHVDGIASDTVLDTLTEGDVALECPAWVSRYAAWHKGRRVARVHACVLAVYLCCEYCVVRGLPCMPRHACARACVLAVCVCSSCYAMHGLLRMPCHATQHVRDVLYVRGVC